MCDSFGSVNPFSGESSKEVEGKASTVCFVGHCLEALTRYNLTLSCCFLESNHKGHLRCLLGSGGVKMCAMLLWAWMMRF